MRADITTDGRYILADIPFAAGAGPRLARQIPGGSPKYSEPAGGKSHFLYWRYPLTMDTCRTFRRLFGDELRVHESLAAWARSEIARNEAMDATRSGAGTYEWQRLPTAAPQLYEAIKTRASSTSSWDRM